MSAKFFAHNVCFIKICRKHSSVLLLCLLRNFMKQTLSENLGRAAALPALQLIMYASLLNNSLWYIGYLS